MIMKLCMEQYVLMLYNVYINDDSELTLIHFKTMSNLAKLVCVLTVGLDIKLASTGPLVIWLFIRMERNAQITSILMCCSVKCLFCFKLVILKVQEVSH